MPAARSSPPVEPALVVILAGVAAALHVGKLPPAVGALQQALGLTLLQAGFLLSLVQAAGMTAGLVFGVLADRIGARRSMLAGLLVLAAAGTAGGFASGVPALMLLRACEGAGFLLVVLPAPGLVRRLLPPQRVSTMLGVWGAYMPLATALALLLGPLCLAAWGWRGWWWLLAGVSLAMALWLQRAVPAQACASAAPERGGWMVHVRETLAAPGPWLVAGSFAMYSGQWLAVIGFLPTVYAQAGLSGTATALLTALVALANMAGNIVSGRLLQRGAAPTRLLATGFAVMGLGAAAAFGGGGSEGGGGGLAPPLRYGAVLLFSGVGGLIPGTLFALAVRVAPSERVLSTTVGWMQQWSALGQFFGPPAVAWIASRAGGWQHTWVATAACSLAGLALSAAIARLRA